MIYGESNGHVTDDVTWPRKVKLIRLERNISKTAGDAIQQQSLITTSAVRQYGQLSYRQLGFLMIFNIAGKNIIN